MNKLIRVDHKQKLYVEQCGSGYSCLGFTVLQNRAKRLAHALGTDWTWKRPCRSTWNNYNVLLNLAQADYVKRGIRQNCELHPMLQAHEHHRVQVIFKDGHKERFIVGKSLGWIPIYLRMKNKSSVGGEAIDRDEEIVSVCRV